MLNMILEFLKNYWDECLSVLSILVALVPLIIDCIKVRKRTIFVNVVDYNIITNAKVSNCDNSESKEGTFLLLAANLFVPDKSFFVEEYEISATLKSGTVSKAMITDGTFTIHNNNKKDVEFVVPSMYNFNLHKEIICEQDNIRIFQIMLLNSNIKGIDEISSINFSFKNKGCSKNITIETTPFPNFNKMKFLSEFEQEISIL